VLDTVRRQAIEPRMRLEEMWKEVTTRLAAITQIESRIRELERENKDVRVPIKQLVESVHVVAKQVAELSAEGKDVLDQIREHDAKINAIQRQ